MLGLLFSLAFLGSLLPPLLLYQAWPIGSIGVILVAYRYGPLRGILAALLACTALIAIWAPPIHPLLTVAEAVIIGTFPKRRTFYLLLGDFYFWIVVAAPVYVLIVHIFFSVPLSVLPVADFLMLAGSGMINAFAAFLLLRLLQRPGLSRPGKTSLIESRLNLLVGSFLAPMVLITALSIRDADRFNSPSPGKNLENRCRKLVRALSERQNELEKKLVELGQSASENGFQQTFPLPEKASRLKERFPGLLWIYAENATGDSSLLSGPDLQGLVKYFRQLKVGGKLKETQTPLVLTVGPSEDISDSTLSLAVPITNTNNNRFLGFVLAGLKSDFYLEPFQRIAARGSDDLVLVDSLGRIVAGNNGIHEPLRYFAVNAGLGRVLVWSPTGNEPTSLFPWNGNNRSPETASWQLILDAIPAKRKAFLRNIALNSFSLLLIPAIGAFLVILRSTDRLRAPILKLAEITDGLPEKVRSGDKIRWPEHKAAEIESLVNNCKAMETALRKTLTELEDLKDKTESDLDRLLSQKSWEVFTAGRKLKIEMDRRRRIEELLENIESAEAKYRFLVEKTLVGVFIVQGKHLSYVNPRFAEIFGYSQEDLQYGELLDLVHPDDRALVNGTLRMQQTEGAGNRQYQFRGQRRNGSIIHVEVLSSRGIYKGQNSLLGTLVDVTDRKKAEETISHMAYHDPLTGLPNRLLFEERARQAIALAERNNKMSALLFLDLDRFKSINDSLGHSIGDQLLKEFANRLESGIRESDIVSRFGGDEFNVMITQISQADDAAMIASKIIELLEAPFQIEGYELFISSSIGIALYPRDGLDVQSLIKNADTALYRAKDLGRNNFQIYCTSMNPRALERMALEASLHRVIERNELRVYYQPQVELTNNRIVGLEALVRWEHPDGHLIPPGIFIPMAEETGLIVSIGEWVLRSACLQIRRWQEEGMPPVVVGINVSACQFQKQELPSLVTEVLRETGIDPQLLNLEITESVVMTDVKEAILTLCRLHDVGITVSIDDFGTGQSSLSYLKDFPVEYLKIDRAFVRNLPHSSQEAEIARHIVEMAHSLKLKVIAEGVERLEQLDFLKKLGCDEIQGFLFSPPVPAEKLTETLRENDACLEPKTPEEGPSPEPRIRMEWPQNGDGSGSARTD